MKTVLVHRLADREIDEAFQFYEQKTPGLGTRFRGYLAQALAFIQEFPLAAPVVDDEIRKCVIRRFPYNLLYSVEDDHILVVAVAHHKRKPGYWTGRVEKG